LEGGLFHVQMSTLKMVYCDPLWFTPISTTKFLDPHSKRGLQRGPMTVVADEDIIGRWEVLGDVRLREAVVRCRHRGKSVSDALGHSPMRVSSPESCCNWENLHQDLQWLVIYQLGRCMTHGRRSTQPLPVRLACREAFTAR